MSDIQRYDPRASGDDMVENPKHGYFVKYDDHIAELERWMYVANGFNYVCKELQARIDELEEIIESDRGDWGDD